MLVCFRGQVSIKLLLQAASHILETCYDADRQVGLKVDAREREVQAGSDQHQCQSRLPPQRIELWNVLQQDARGKHRQRSDRGRTTEQKFAEPEQKCSEVSVGLPQVHVDSPRLRKHRRQFRETQRPPQGEQTSHDPGRQDNAKISATRRDLSRLGEDPRSDHPPHDHRRRHPRTQRSNQPRGFRSRGRLRRGEIRHSLRRGGVFFRQRLVSSRRSDRSSSGHVQHFIYNPPAVGAPGDPGDETVPLLA